MVAENRLLDLVGTVYDCALDPSGWPAALERIAIQVQGICASISIQDPLTHQARFTTAWGAPPDAISSYNEKYAALNPVMTSGWYCAIDEPISAARYAGEQAYFSSRFAKEFLRPLGWGDAIGSHLMKSNSRYGILAIFAPWDRGAYDRELEIIRQLSPHVRRATTIGDLLNSRALKHDMLSATLDLLNVGIVLVDKDARIVHANHSAQHHLDDQRALRRDGDHLAARDPKASHELRQAITSAAVGTTIDMPMTGTVVPVAGVDRDLAAWVLPLDFGLRGELAAPFAARAAVFVREIGDTAAFTPELFVKRYAISPAECRVLMMLVQGMTISEASDALGISEPTVKTHLAHLFSKTETYRQSDLMRLAMTALAPASRLPN